MKSVSGCGSGANLYFFKRDGFKVGGSDYAENLLNAETKDEYLAYRRAHTKKFDKHHMEGFWNEPFNFDCFLYRKSAG